MNTVNTLLLGNVDFFPKGVLKIVNREKSILKEDKLRSPYTTVKMA